MNDDKLWIDLPKNLIGDTLTCPSTALRSLHENICIFDHLKEDLFTFFRKIIQSYRALIAAFCLLDIGGVANSVTSTSVLKPGNICTPISHQISCLWASKLYCSINNLYVVKWTKGRLFGW